MIGETLLFIGASRIVCRTPSPPQRQEQEKRQWSLNLIQGLEEKREGFELGF